MQWNRQGPLLTQGKLELLRDMFLPLWNLYRPQDIELESYMVIYKAGLFGKLATWRQVNIKENKFTWKLSTSATPGISQAVK